MTSTEPVDRKPNASNGNTGRPVERLDPVALANIARILRVGLARAAAAEVHEAA